MRFGNARFGATPMLLSVAEAARKAVGVSTQRQFNVPGTYTASFALAVLESDHAVGLIKFHF
jgi:hypothetical protein